jgi:hypothetical protein
MRTNGLRQYSNVALLAAALLAQAGCAPDSAITPTDVGKDAGARPSLISGSAVLNAELRTAPGLPSLEWGHVQLKIGFQTGDPCIPPDPIVPPDFTAVAVCGKIFNPGGARFLGGGLYVTVPGEGGVPTVELIRIFEGAIPPDPCRRYDLSGYVPISNEDAQNLMLAPSAYSVRFDGATVDGWATQIGGFLDGGAWGPVGQVDDSDAFFAANACNVKIIPPTPI